MTIRTMRVPTLVLAVGLIAGCTTPAPQERKLGEVDLDAEFVQSLPADPGLIDPQGATTIYQIAVVLAVFEPLISFDPKTLAPAPAAAELPSISSDGLTYAFKLRPGLTYSDGVPLKASDFAYAISRLCEPDVQANTAFIPVVVRACAELNSLDPETASPNQLLIARRNLRSTGIVAVSDRDLEIHLVRPAPYMLAFFGLGLTAPSRQRDIERNGDDWYLDPANYIGNGPFILTEWIDNKRLVFERNPRFRTPAKTRRITRLIFDREDRGSSDAMLAAYRAGRIDAAHIEDVSILKDITAAGLGSELSYTPYACNGYLRLNHARPPLDDINVRLALAKSIDRNAYVKTIAPLSEVATSFVPRGIPGHDPDDHVQDLDLAAARALLAQSRYAGTDALRGLKWEIGSLQGKAPLARAEFIANQWRALGLDVKVEVIDHGLWTRLRRNINTFPLFATGGWCVDYPDAQDFLSVFFSYAAQRGPQDLGYRNPTVEALLKEADSALDLAKRGEAYLRASRQISADVGMIPLTYGLTASITKPWVRGLNASAMDPGGFYHPADIAVVRH